MIRAHGAPARWLKNDITMESIVNLRTCLQAYSVMRSMLLCMSATDASSFVCATGVRPPRKLMAAISSPVNDIPEHIEWMNEMMRLGNKVLLVGSDLDRLKNRIRYPDTRGELATRTLCIWIAVIPEKEICYNRGIGTSDEDFPHDSYYVFKDGTLRKLDHNAHRAIHPRDRPYASMFIPRVDDTRPLPGGYGGSEWHISDIPNENNIKVVYFATRHNGMTDLNACLAPISRASYVNDAEHRACYKEITGNTIVGKATYNVPLLDRQPTSSQWQDGTLLPWMRLNDGVTGAAGSDEENSALGQYEPRKYFKLHTNTAGAMMRGSTGGADASLHTFFIPYR